MSPVLSKTDFELSRKIVKYIHVGHTVHKRQWIYGHTFKNKMYIYIIYVHIYIYTYLSFTLFNRYAQPSGLFQALLVWQIVFVDGPIGKTNKQPIPKYSWSSGKHGKPIENHCLGNRFLLTVLRKTE